jgi:phosphocarrier protein
VTVEEVVVSNRLGLHARAAARFVHEANSFRARIVVSRAECRVNGKSILGLLTLAASRGTRLVVSAEGDDAEEAVRCLTRLVGDRFGEGA